MLALLFLAFLRLCGGSQCSFPATPDEVTSEFSWAIDGKECRVSDIAVGDSGNALYFLSSTYYDATVFVYDLATSALTTQLNFDGVKPVRKSLAIAADESYAYFMDTNMSVNIYRVSFDSPDSTVFSSTDATLRADYLYSRLYIAPGENDILYFSTLYGTTRSNICLFTISSESFNCIEVNLFNNEFEMLALDSSRVFFNGAIPGTIMKSFVGDFSQTADMSNFTKWGFEFDAGPNNMGPAALYGNIYKIYFYLSTIDLMVIDPSDGSIVGKRWTGHLYCMNMHEGEVFEERNGALKFAWLCQTNTFIYIYDIDNEKMEMVAYASSVYTGALAKLTTGEIILTKAYDPCEALIFTIDTIETAPNFGTSSNIEYAQVSPSDFGLTSITNTFTHTSSTSENTTTTPTVPVTTFNGSTYSSDLHYNDTTEKFLTLLEHSNITLQLNLSCSVSGNTDFKYIKRRLNKNNLVPSWVGKISTNGKLSMTTPAASDKTYKFRIGTKVDGAVSPSSVYKKIHLKILNCTIENCDQCETLNAGMCKVCSSGYNVTESGTCNFTESETVVFVAKSSTQAVTGIGAGLAVTSSLLNFSYPTAVWSMVNQMQFCILLMLTGAYYPIQIRDYLSGQAIFSFNFGFVPVMELPYVSYPLKMLDFTHGNLNLEMVGVESGSSFVNNFGFLATLVFIAFAHLLVFCMPKCKEKAKKSPRVKKVRKCLKKTQKGFKWGTYIRVSIEAFQILLLSSLAEIYLSDVGTSPMRISLAICGVFITFLAVLLGIACYYALRGTPYEIRDEHNFMEFFAGMKLRRRSQFYICFIMIRRVIYVITVVFLKLFLPVWHTAAIFFYVQILNLIYLYKVSPFLQKQDNVVELINEHYFTTFVFLQFIFPEEGDWSKFSENFTLWFMTSNSIVVSFVLLGFVVKGSCSKYCKKKEGKIEKFKQPPPGRFSESPFYKRDKNLRRERLQEMQRKAMSEGSDFSGLGLQHSQPMVSEEMPSFGNNGFKKAKEQFEPKFAGKKVRDLPIMKHIIMRTPEEMAKRRAEFTFERDEEDSS